MWDASFALAHDPPKCKRFGKDTLLLDRALSAPAHKSLAARPALRLPLRHRWEQLPTGLNLNQHQLSKHEQRFRTYCEDGGFGGYPPYPDRPLHVDRRFRSRP